MKRKKMKAIHRLIHNKKGLSYIYSVVIVIVLSLIFAVVFEYARIYTIISSVRDNTQIVLDSFCIKKAKEIYGYIRNGKDYLLNDNLTNEFLEDISSEFKLIDNSSNLWYNENEKGEIIFKFDNLLIANLDGNKLTLTCSYTIEVPSKIGVFNVPDISVPITLKSSYLIY